MNPNMHPKRLKKFFEDLGFKDVTTVIASGNVVFSSNSKKSQALEAKIERELPLKLGFKSSTIIRSRSELERLAKMNPFRGVIDEKPNYLLVTFFKNGAPELCSVLDLGNSKTPEFMRELDKTHGKLITSRTWKTVLRILRKMENI
ncbi:MAG: hypothetical protein RIQ56_297 [Candidatus Parcubacteria bacterium]|jgi:uncharacterized protein (DUF1697 family)